MLKAENHLNEDVSSGATTFVVMNLTVRSSDPTSLSRMFYGKYRSKC